MPPQCPHRQAFGTTLGPVDLSSDYLEFSRVLCNRLSTFFICNPQFPLMPPTLPASPKSLYTPCQPPIPPLSPHHQCRHLVVKSSTTAAQHDMLSACRSGCCFVRCTPTPSCSLNAPRERHLVAKSGPNLGPVDLSSDVP